MIQLGGRRMVGFGVGDFAEDIERKYDPLYGCHNDKTVGLKVFGAVVATALVTAGTILYVVPFIKTEYELRNRSMGMTERIRRPRGNRHTTYRGVPIDLTHWPKTHDWLVSVSWNGFDYKDLPGSFKTERDALNAAKKAIDKRIQ